MYAVKMMFVLIQVGTNLWVNPMQIKFVAATPKPTTECATLVYTDAPDLPMCSDWSLGTIKAILSPAAVAKAMEGK